MPDQALEQAACILHLRRCFVLHWALVFVVFALVAALLGFGGLAAGAAAVAKVLFFAFLVLAALSFLGGILRERTA